MTFSCLLHWAIEMYLITKAKRTYSKKLYIANIICRNQCDTTITQLTAPNSFSVVWKFLKEMVLFSRNQVRPLKTIQISASSGSSLAQGGPSLGLSNRSGKHFLADLMTPILNAIFLLRKWKKWKMLIHCSVLFQQVVVNRETGRI